MRRTFLVIVALAGLVAASAVVVFHYGHDLSWLDSVYFVVTTMMTVGYGDIIGSEESNARSAHGLHGWPA